jgi:hypothetical protein
VWEAHLLRCQVAIITSSKIIPRIHRATVPSEASACANGQLISRGYSRHALPAPGWRHLGTSIDCRQRCRNVDVVAFCMRMRRSGRCRYINEQLDSFPGRRRWRRPPRGRARPHASQEWRRCSGGVKASAEWEGRSSRWQAEALASSSTSRGRAVKLHFPCLRRCSPAVTGELESRIQPGELVR